MFRSIKIVFLVLVGAVILIGTPSMQGPSNLSAEAIPDKDGNPGGALKLTWEEPEFTPGSGGGCWGSSEEEADEWHYDVYLDGVLVAEEITGTEYDLYVQGGVIEMTAVWGDVESDVVRLDTRPISIVTFTVYELNGEGASGIGFRVNAEAIATYSMASDINKENIDCYFTDYTTGWMGRFHLASPSELANDKGNTWLDTHGWRTTLISGALGDFDTITVVPPVDGNYNSTAPVAVNQPYAVLTQDNYYGLIQIEGIDETLGEIYIKATFQPIKGLRWM